jgi:hypothetical protein
MPADDRASLNIRIKALYPSSRKKEPTSLSSLVDAVSGLSAQRHRGNVFWGLSSSLLVQFIECGVLQFPSKLLIIEREFADTKAKRAEAEAMLHQFPQRAGLGDGADKGVRSPHDNGVPLCVHSRVHTLFSLCLCLFR